MKSDELNAILCEDNTVAGTNGDELARCMRLDKREGQLELVSLSQTCIAIAVQSLLAVTSQNQSLGPLSNQLIYTVFNLFKASVYYLNKMNLLVSKEHFNDT